MVRVIHEYYVNYQAYFRSILSSCQPLILYLRKTNDCRTMLNAANQVGKLSNFKTDDKMCHRFQKAGFYLGHHV